MAAGDASGLIQIFDIDKKIVLRTLEGHSQGARVVKYFSDKTRLLSGSDDQSCIVWDIPTQKRLDSFQEHTDYVRAGCISTQNQNIFLSGSYDHAVKLWDTRQSSSRLTMDHGGPVESVLMMPGDSVAISCGRNYFKVWDLLAGGRLISTICNHQKTITCMALDKTRTMLLTGSVDQYVKIYDMTTDYSVVHSLQYPAPILSMALGPNDSHLVVGMTNGVLSIREKSIVDDGEMALEQDQQEGDLINIPKMAAGGDEENYRVGSYRYFLRGALSSSKSKSKADHDDDDLDDDLDDDDDDNVFSVEKERGKSLKKFDRFLRKFQYKDALDAALDQDHAVTTFSVFEELVARGALVTAISGRDEESLTPVLQFISKNVTNPAFSELLVSITGSLLDIYAPILGRSDTIDTLFTNIRHSIHEEIQFQKRLCELQGIMDMIISTTNLQ